MDSKSNSRAKESWRGRWMTAGRKKARKILGTFRKFAAKCLDLATFEIVVHRPPRSYMCGYVSCINERNNSKPPYE